MGFLFGPLRRRANWFGGLVIGFSAGLVVAGRVPTATQADDSSRAPAMKRWSEGKGWGWVWGAEDEVGSLNEMTDRSRLAALHSVQTGKVYDLGVLYSRRSYKWPGHSPGEILSFRTPEGIKRQRDVPSFTEPAGNPIGLAWHSCSLFLSDNVGTQLDGLGHITVGENNHWYNGFKESDWGGNFGIRRCGAETIPPIVARGVLLDIAGLRGVEALPPGYVIRVEDIEAAAARQNVTLRPGDVVLLRTGAMSRWGTDGADHDAIAKHDSAGISLETARYLVEKKGAMVIGSDTSGLEVSPSPKNPNGEPSSPIPVHRYLLVEQGVHIGELHDLEMLARDKVYEFCYVALTNKIAGTTAGFCLRPIAIR